MLDTLQNKDQQSCADFVTEGVTRLTAVEMNRILQECGYEHQRGISEKHVEVLADLMKRGQWQPKSQIDFAVLNGRLILVNGYHRGYAQVRSGRPITWAVMLHPCKSEADLRSLYFAFDTNIRIRGTGDILRAYEFGETHGLTNVAADSLYRAVPFISSRFEMAASKKDFMTAKAVDRRLAVAAEYAKAAARYAACLDGLPGGRKKQYLGGAVMAVAAVTFRFQDQIAWQFWTGAAKNDGLPVGDVRRTLYNDMLTRKRVGNTVGAFAPVIIAWNAFFSDRQLKSLVVPYQFVPKIDGTPFDGKAFTRAS